MCFIQRGWGEEDSVADHDVAIVGGGIAGLSAALVARQIGLRTVVIDPLLGGGQLVNIDRIDNYPGLDAAKGFEVGPQLAGRAMGAGAVFDITTVTGITCGSDSFTISLDRGGTVTARAVIIAVGSQVRFAGLPGEEEYRGRGVSYCAVCDGPFFAGKSVVVAGGGDSAADEAVHLATLARHVVIVHPGVQMQAMAWGQERVSAQENVRRVAGARVVAIFGGSDGVTGVRVREESGAEQDLPADGVFLYTGLEPNTAFLRGVVAMDENGHIAVNHALETDVPGVFAAGDIRQGSARLLIAAAGDGASAAVRVAEWLRQGRPSA